jgi:DNA-binding transcriptional LysR family regulator
VHLELVEDSGARLLPMLFAGSLDAVFCRAPQRLPAGFVFEPLLDDEAVVVAGAGHALAGRTGLPMAALAGARWVLPAASIQLREVFESVVLAALPQASWFPVSTLSLPALEGLLQQPGAVSLLPRSMCAGLLAGGRLCRLDVVLSAPLAPLGVAYAEAGGSELLRGLLALARRPEAGAPARG